MGNSLTVECLGPRAFNAEGPGSIPGQGTKIPQAMQWSKKTNENKKERKNKQKKPGGGSALQSESQSPVKSLKCSLWLLLPSYWSEHISFSPSLILFQPHWPSLWYAKMSGAYTYFFYSWNALHICICIENLFIPFKCLLKSHSLRVLSLPTSSDLSYPDLHLSLFILYFHTIHHFLT